jgi:glycosyltransferase involved in cell wall biosynthesis
MYLQHVWKSLKRYEIKQLDNFDGIAAITKADAAFFEGENRGPEVHAISFGIEMNDQALEKCTEKKNSVFHIGSMDWMPNQEGIQWFLKNVWPLVISQNPELVLYLAGRNMPSWLINKKQEGVEIVGEVEDAGVFMRQHQLMVVPLLSGSGIRIKIIEGMANARAIVTTKIGAEGIAYTSGENLFIAENEVDFAKKILLLAGNDELREKTGEKALELLHQKHNKKELIRDLIAFYERCLTKKNGR